MLLLLLRQNVGLTSPLSPPFVVGRRTWPKRGQVGPVSTSGRHGRRWRADQRL